MSAEEIKVIVSEGLRSDTEHGQLYAIRGIPFQVRRKITAYRFLREGREQGKRYFYFAITRAVQP